MANSFTPLAAANIVAGRGSLDYLGAFTGRRVSVIHAGPDVLPENVKKRMVSLVEETGGECMFASPVLQEPYFSDIQRVTGEITEYGPDMIVAVGGGAVLDTAKAAHLFYEYPELGTEDILKPYQLPRPGRKALLVAVPTTSGTGSETTSAAVFTDDRTKQKKLMLDNGLIPAYAILDADFTDTLPAHVAAYTGMDALAHALEASVCTTASPLVEAVAVSAAVDLFENLPDSVSAGTGSRQQHSAREKCHIAASLAGVAITNSCAGLAHGLDQPGPHFDIPHGQVCGILLPYTTAFAGVQPSYLAIAGRLGLEGRSDPELCQALVDYMAEFNRRIGIPGSFAQAGVGEKEFMENLDHFAELAASAIATKLSPKVPQTEQARKILQDAYHGKPPLVREADGL